MLSLLSKKFIMAGIITITVPFGVGSGTGTGWTVPTSATAPNSSVSSNLSYNWSGYQATGGTFTAVRGTWTVPAVPSANSTAADATWVGIGGAASHDLIQAGTQAYIDGSGAPAYEAWYETLPQATQQVPLTISPGDSITASLSQNSPGQWWVNIRDNTTGQSYQSLIPYNSSLSSAEWIEEMPSDGTRFVPLDNFGSVSFSDASAVENGSSASLAGAHATELTMVNNDGQTLSTPSAIGPDDTSFTVTRITNNTPVSSTMTSIGSRRSGAGRSWRRTGIGIDINGRVSVAASSVWDSWYQVRGILNGWWRSPSHSTL